MEDGNAASIRSDVATFVSGTRDTRPLYLTDLEVSFQPVDFSCWAATIFIIIYPIIGIDKCLIYRMSEKKVKPVLVLILSNPKYICLWWNSMK